jgi:hypothetical protein
MIVVVVVGATLAWRHLGHLVVEMFAGAALAMVLAGLVVMTAGNLRVAQSIWRTPYGDEEVDQIGSAFSGFDSGHDLQGTGDLVVLLGGVAFALFSAFRGESECWRPWRASSSRLSPAVHHRPVAWYS